MIPFFSSLFCIGLPAFGLWRLQAGRSLKRPYLLAAGSMAFCGISMLEELYTIKQRAFGGDMGGIQDTIDAVLTICIVLLVVAVLLNLLFLWFAFELAKEDAAGAGPSVLQPRAAGPEDALREADAHDPAARPQAIAQEPLHQPVKGGCTG